MKNNISTIHVYKVLIIAMLKISPFKENIYARYKRVAFAEHFAQCPLCERFKYNENKYDIGNNKNANVLHVYMTYNNGKGLRFLMYCLHCETLFGSSHTITDNAYSGFSNYSYTISKFEYENKVELGTPHFDSFFCLIQEIREKKLNSLTFTCSCANNNLSNDVEYDFDSQFPSVTGECVGNFELNDITDIAIRLDKSPYIYLVPKSTKPALKK